MVHHNTEIDWSPSEGSVDFALRDFAMHTVHGPSAEIFVALRPQKVVDVSVVFEREPAVHVHWLPGVQCKTISDFEQGYRRYCGVIDGDGGLLADVTSTFADNVGELFAQEAL